MSRYGLPFMGSKNKLAKRIVNLLPSAEHLYDLFAGGCAVSHAALLSGKWKCVHFSDITDSVVLFRDCLEGNIPDVSEWISREEFFRRKDSDPYVRIIWSFGNNQQSYIYSREIEPYKKAVHEMIYAPTPNERRLKFKSVCRLMSEIYSIGKRQNTPPTEPKFTTRDKLPETVCRLQSMERVIQTPQNYRIFSDLTSSERVQYLSKANLIAIRCDYEMRVASYKDIEILPNSVIYCDIPYKGTCEYLKQNFDYDAFYEWCEKQTHPVFISEYWMPEDRFTCIAQFERTSTMSPTNNSNKEIEKVFIPKHQVDEYLKNNKQLELFE